MSMSERQVTTWIIRIGVAALGVAVIALSGFLLTFSPDSVLIATGWQVFKFGMTGVFLLMDLFVATSALRAWREGKGVAGALVLATFLFLTPAVFFVLFRADLAGANLLFAAGAVVGVVAPFVQAIHDRRHRLSETPR